MSDRIRNLALALAGSIAALPPDQRRDAMGVVLGTLVQHSGIAPVEQLGAWGAGYVVAARTVGLGHEDALRGIEGAWRATEQALAAKQKLTEALAATKAGDMAGAAGKLLAASKELLGAAAKLRGEKPPMAADPIDGIFDAFVAARREGVDDFAEFHALDPDPIAESTPVLETDLTEATAATEALLRAMKRGDAP